MSVLITSLSIPVPAWAADHAASWTSSPADEDKMRFAIALAHMNVLHDGGPFAAAVFEQGTGTLVSVGVNSVMRTGNSVLHAETVAIMTAQRRRGSYSLRGVGLPDHELIVTCDPCAMCLGALLWSGIRRVVCGADRGDAAEIGFDEGPVFPGTYHYLEERGVAFLRGVLRGEAAAVLRLYRDRGGPIYNG